jgi:hypothetical protein
MPRKSLEDKCPFSRARDWVACDNYEPIGGGNKVCAYSGCGNVCVYEGARRKEVQSRIKEVKAR